MIRYTPDALDDLERLYRWLLDRNPIAAERFLERLAEAARRIAERPMAWPPSADGRARRHVMRFGRSAYVLHYVIDDLDQVIVRVWHGRQRRTER